MYKIIKRSNLSLLALVCFLFSCDRSGNEVQYFLTLKDKNVVNYGTTEQPIARVYEAKLEQQSGNISVSTGSSRNPLENSLSTKGLAIMVKPSAGGRVAVMSATPQFKDSVAIGTDNAGNIKFLWQAGPSLGYQNVKLELVLEVKNTIKDRVDYIPRTLSNLELQQDTPLGSLVRLKFRSNIIEHGTVSYLGDEVKVGALGDEQSGFRQVWTAENLKSSNQGSGPNGDPANIDEFGSLFTYPQAQEACPSGFRLATIAEYECMSTNVNADCEITLAPFSFGKQKAGGLVCRNLNTCNSSDLEYNLFGTSLKFWINENSVFGLGVASYRSGTLNCLGFDANRKDFEGYSVRCIKDEGSVCP